jgi:hypothetical protein
MGVKMLVAEKVLIPEKVLVPEKVLLALLRGIVAPEVPTFNPVSASKVPRVLPHNTTSPVVVDPGPVIIPPAENALGGAGEALRFPQRVFAGNTPVH